MPEEKLAANTIPCGSWLASDDVITANIIVA
jgi:hypothetical protein